MRVLIYGTLALIALILGVDTHVGTRLSTSETGLVQHSADLLLECHLQSDAQIAGSMIKADAFRKSIFFDWLNNLSQTHGGAFGFYAYTPVFSRRLIFLGPNYWLQDTRGRASVTVHELAHLRRHQHRSLGGFPRPADEVVAYTYQYRTYPAIGISPGGAGSDVYWDMMFGVRDYVIPEHPEYAGRKDVARALEVIGRVD